MFISSVSACVCVYSLYIFLFQLSNKTEKVMEVLWPQTMLILLIYELITIFLSLITLRDSVWFWVFLFVVSQRTSCRRTQENVQYVWRIWSRETPSLACPASASITKGKAVCACVRASDVSWFSLILTLLSFSCIDEWFEVNRSCPEHPSD